jgi:hypothetical protein
VNLNCASLRLEKSPTCYTRPANVHCLFSSLTLNRPTYRTISSNILLYYTLKSKLKSPISRKWSANVLTASNTVTWELIVDILLVVFAVVPTIHPQNAPNLVILQQNVYYAPATTLPITKVAMSTEKSKVAKHLIQKVNFYTIL